MSSDLLVVEISISRTLRFNNSPGRVPDPRIILWLGKSKKCKYRCLAVLDVIGFSARDCVKTLLSLEVNGDRCVFAYCLVTNAGKRSICRWFYAHSIS